MLKTKITHDKNIFENDICKKQTSSLSDTSSWHCRHC